MGVCCGALTDRSAADYGHLSLLWRRHHRQAGGRTAAVAWQFRLLCSDSNACAGNRGKSVMELNVRDAECKARLVWGFACKREVVKAWCFLGGAGHHQTALRLHMLDTMELFCAVCASLGEREVARSGHVPDADPEGRRRGRGCTFPFLLPAIICNKPD